MSVRVNREELKRCLACVEGGLSPRPFMEQSSSYILDDGWVSTFNNEVCARARTPLPKDITGAVRAKELFKCLDKMTDEFVRVELAKNELVVSNDGGVEVAVVLQREIVLPVDEVELPEEWRPLPHDFGDAVRKVTGVSATKGDEFIPLCVNIAPTHIEGTDRRQFCRYKIETGLSESYLVRSKSLAQVAKLDVTKMGETEAWVHFRNGNVIYSARRHADEFLDTDEIYDYHGNRAELPSGGEDWIKIAAEFCKETDNDKVSVELTDDLMTVRSRNQHGRASVPLPMRYNGPKLGFRIAPEMLVQLVRDNRDCEIGDKIVIRGDRWTYLSGLAADVPQNGRTSYVRADDDSGDDNDDAGD